jgi:hypothetical protein
MTEVWIGSEIFLYPEEAEIIENDRWLTVSFSYGHMNVGF